MLIGLANNRYDCGLRQICRALALAYAAVWYDRIPQGALGYNRNGGRAHGANGRARNLRHASLIPRTASHTSQNETMPRRAFQGVQSHV